MKIGALIQTRNARLSCVLFWDNADINFSSFIAFRNNLVWNLETFYKKKSVYLDKYRLELETNEIFIFFREDTRCQVSSS